MVRYHQCPTTGRRTLFWWRCLTTLKWYHAPQHFSFPLYRLIGVETWFWQCKSLVVRLWQFNWEIFELGLSFVCVWSCSLWCVAAASLVNDVAWYASPSSLAALLLLLYDGVYCLMNCSSCSTKLSLTVYFSKSVNARLSSAEAHCQTRVAACPMAWKTERYLYTSLREFLLCRMSLAGRSPPGHT